MTLEYKTDCVHYNSIQEVCNIHIDNCKECNLYIPKMRWNQKVKPEREMDLDELRKGGSMACWEDDE